MAIKMFNVERMIDLLTHHVYTYIYVWNLNERNLMILEKCRYNLAHRAARDTIARYNSGFPILEIMSCYIA